MRRAVAPISSATLTGTVDIIPRAINARPSFAHHIPNLLDWGQGSHQIRTICRMEWDRQQVSDAPLLARLPPQVVRLRSEVKDGITRLGDVLFWLGIIIAIGWLVLSYVAFP